jgi:hypothetical protein
VPGEQLSLGRSLVVRRELRFRLHSFVIILDTDDIVLAEMAAGLDLDQLQRKDRVLKSRSNPEQRQELLRVDLARGRP